MNIMTPNYEELTKIRELYPENQIDVPIFLEIEGDGGWLCCNSLKAEIFKSERAKTYSELIKGKGGKHSSS